MASIQLSILTVFFLVTNFLITTGVIYGWAGLQRQLIREGQFSSGCSPSLLTCPSQDSSLSTIAIVAFNMANLGTVVHGFTLDRYGVRANAVFGGLLFTIGMLLLSVSDSQRFNAFIPAYTAIGWGGIAVFLASFQFANLFARPNLWRAIINALFTAAGLSFTLIDWMHQAGIKRDVVLGIYASVAAVLTMGMLLLYPVHAYEEGDQCSLPIVEWYTGYTPAKKQHAEPVLKGEKEEQHDDGPNEWSHAAAHAESTGLSLHDEVPLDDDSSLSTPHDPLTPSLPSSSSSSSLSDADDKKRRATLWDEVKDPQTLALSLFFSFGLLFSNWLNATVATQLSLMGDSSGDWAIAFIFLSSFLPIPIAALIAHWLRTIGYAGSVAICAATLSLSYLPLYVPLLPLQLLSFTLYTLSRALVISIMFTYAATQYRGDHYGRIVAIVTIIATPLGFLQLLMQDKVGQLGYDGINTI